VNPLRVRINADLIYTSWPMKCFWKITQVFLNSSLLNSKENLTVTDVHNAFDGNICRCTGYRPIMDAFKSFAMDAPPEIRDKCKDIEDVSQSVKLQKYIPQLIIVIKYKRTESKVIVFVCIHIQKCSGCPCAPKAGSGCCRAQALTTNTKPFDCNSTLKLNLNSGQEWLEATDLASALLNLDRFSKDGKKYRVVAGNTGTGNII